MIDKKDANGLKETEMCQARSIGDSMIGWSRTKSKQEKCFEPEIITQQHLFFTLSYEIVSCTSNLASLCLQKPWTTASVIVVC